MRPNKVCTKCIFRKFRTITQEEWAAHTAEGITKADKELASGRPLRAYIDVVLKQIIDDLWRQYDLVNSAFYRRIEQTKEQKTKFENHHFEVREDTEHFWWCRLHFDVKKSSTAEDTSSPAELHLGVQISTVKFY